MKPMTWAFLVDSVPFTKATRDGETSLGGSESACLGLARALVARGHDVHIFATKLSEDAMGQDAAGVVWHRAEHFLPMNAFVEWDVVVALRMYAWFGRNIQARLRLLWNQDMLMPGMGAGVMSVAYTIDKSVYVSEYHRKQWESEQPELAPFGWVTRNGYDPSQVPTTIRKDPNRIIHISRPERGLGPLLTMWPALKAAVPAATLQICRYASMYDGEGSDVRAMVEASDAAVADVNERVGGIIYLGSLNKPQLYQAIADAGVMWYPGVANFAETSCIAAIETQACGTPLVGSLKGALPETAKPAYEAGFLIAGDADKDAAYHQASIAAVTELLDGCRRNSFDYRKLQQAGRAHVAAYTYAAIAAEWEAFVAQEFAQRYEARKLGVLRQLVHEEDRITARLVAREIVDDILRTGAHAYEGLPFETVIERTGTPDLKEAAEAVVACDRVIAGRTAGPAEYSAHAIQDPLYEVEFSDRFRAVNPHFKDCTRVLDVACGNGAFAIGLALAYSHLQIVALDYSPVNIEHAREAAQRAGVADRCQFQTATVYDFAQQTMHADWRTFMETCGDFDGLFVGEFVEHVAPCERLVDALEEPLADGAVVVYTCPSGPFRELTDRGQVLQQTHVHCFKQDDVKAVWGLKKQANSQLFSIGTTRRGAPVGHWIISYRRAANCPARPRDLQTRALRTRPLQRLSVGLIVKDGEFDLARCLNSVWPIADEIVIGDTGSTDDTKAIAAKFDARVIDIAPVQAQPEGFAGARNDVLFASTGDWFLWIDADEALIDSVALRKYLDGPIYQGFVIHQHHLQIDAPTHYDIPVRLFRRTPAIQFYGCIHEQPQQGDCNGEIYPALETYDIKIAHTGYLTDAIRRDKMLRRNLPLLVRDQQVFPNRELGKVFVLRDYVNLADVDCERAQALTEKAQSGYAHAVRMFTTHFDDPAHKFHAVARPFYELALKRLGVGWEMEIGLAGKALGMGPKHAQLERVWVRDATEFQRILAHRAKAVAAGMVTKTAITDPFIVTTPTPEGAAA